MITLLGRETTTSPLCRGYDSGITCIACCAAYERCYIYYINQRQYQHHNSHHNLATMQHLSIVEAPILLKAKDYDESKHTSNRRNSRKQHKRTPHIIHIGETCNNSFNLLKSTSIIGIHNIYSDFEKALKEFHSQLGNNTCVFEKKIREETTVEDALEKIGLSNNLLGWIQELMPGCLLYKYNKPGTEISYRPTECVGHLCSLAYEASEALIESKSGEIIRKKTFNEAVPEIIKEFINNHRDDKRLNSLSYSRMIHLIDQHPDVLDFLGIYIFFSRETKKECMRGLETMFEVVTK